MTARSKLIALVSLLFITSVFHPAFAESTGEKIASAARDCVGKEMWRTGYGLKSGGLGCAASVSNVLKVAGVKHVGSPVTLYMRRQILKGPPEASEYVIKNGGDDPIDDGAVRKNARPGDVLVAFMDPLPRGNIGPKAHCGIIGPNGSVFTNDWNDGVWKNSDIHTYFDSYRYIRVLRIP